MGKIIIKFDGMSERAALKYVQMVVFDGRISTNKNGDQYCFGTRFKDGTSVSAFKPSKSTDTFVVFKESKSL